MTTGGMMGMMPGGSPAGLDPVSTVASILAGEGGGQAPTPAAGGYFSLTRDLKFGSPLYTKTLSRLQQMYKLADTERSRHTQRWRDAEEQVLAYVPETEADARRRSRREKGEPTFTTIQIPYTFAQVMAAHTYWTSVFLARSPVHQISGRHGEGEMQIQAVEALLDYQITMGRMMAPYYLWVYDGAKYGVGWLGTWWDSETVQYTTLEEWTDPQTGKTEKVQITRRVQGYQGNRAYNISPYDAFPDPRVTVGNFQDGEFFGVRCSLMWADVVRRAKRGMYVNLDRIGKQQGDARSDTLDGSPQLERPRTDWVAQSDGAPGKHPSVLSVFEWYVELIPEEWELGGTDFPEKWVFTFTTDMSVLIGAQPLGLVHGKFPVDVIEPEIEGYGIYNRGVPEIMFPIQRTMDWLINTRMYNVRATLNNGYIIDPTKIYMRDVAKGGPGFVWRMRPEAFGQDIGTFFKQVPITDVTQSQMGDLQQMFAIGERVFGINDQILGMLAEGGRKTATEIRTSTGFGVNRLKTTAEWISATAFAPHAQKLIQSSQQYYDADLKLKIVGDLAGFAGERFLSVTPDSILGGFDFTPVDGTLPVDRFAQLTAWRENLQMAGAIPQILEQYDLGRIFGWMMQMGGIRNLDRFKIQIGDPTMLAAQAQAGNVVPIRGSSGAANAGAASAGGSSGAVVQ